VRLFKNTWFNRFAKKEGITDDELRGFKHDAKTDLSLTDEQINEKKKKGTLIEIP
jgi:hypothetical protein